MSAAEETATTAAASAATAEDTGMSAGELAQLSLSELIAKLEPIPEPTPISYFPETAIWIWLAAGLACGLLLLAWLALRRWRARAYRRGALAELRRAEDIGSMASILRRAALVAYPRDDVAGLIGEDWLAFLDHTLARADDLDPQSERADGGSREPRRSPANFRTPIGRTLLTASYVDDASRASMMREASALRALVERWVRDHRADRTREAA